MSAKRSFIFFNIQYVPGEKGGSIKDPLKPTLLSPGTYWILKNINERLALIGAIKAYINAFKVHSFIKSIIKLP